MKPRQGDTTRLALFASELGAARSAAGLSQEALAAQLAYSLSLVSMIEGCKRADARIRAALRRGFRDTGHVRPAAAALADDAVAGLVPRLCGRGVERAAIALMAADGH